MASAGVVIGGTRVVYSCDKSDATITVKNNEAAIPYLIQTWVDPFSNTGTAKNHRLPSFHRYLVWRLGRKNSAHYENRGQFTAGSGVGVLAEHQKYSPASNKPNAMEIAIKTRIKLIWRPASLNITPERAATQVKWHRENRQLVVENPTPLNINVMNVTVDGKDVPLNIVHPFETLRLPLPEGVNGHALVWRYVNDFGAISQDLKAAL